MDPLKGGRSVSTMKVRGSRNSRADADLSLPSIDSSTGSRQKTPSTLSSSSKDSRQRNPFQWTQGLNVTAQAWSILDANSGEMLWGWNERARLEMASLTKAMTCYLVIRIVNNSNELSFDSVVTVSRLAASMKGTSAYLQEGDELTIWDLLHGMMLPSGNDAAWCLAEFVGKYIQSVLEESVKNKNYTRYFIREMNALAQEIGLMRTSFDNPHGLSNPKNRSSAYDLGKLVCICMRNPFFREIVRTRSYVCYVFQPNEPNIYRKAKWQNTNKLLNEGWSGVKTGVTKSAGPCMSACCCVSDKLSLVITTLNSDSTEQRWCDVVQLASWAVSSLKLE